ncbi:sulfotransferase family protein [Rhodovulum steppense]|uniref:Sulfotransferase family protein n=1 Tax=Rhodovulum steppense TaxID=540251 RepID=A0A4V2R496_9RHOB|nr:sulfotransferase family protein [Rhodovulum steppense]TCM82642.1 sulfotransferase family protein [Rhodovulum steppense]
MTLELYRTDPSQELSDRLARPLYRALYPFYRRYPYRGRVSLFHIEHRGAFSPEDGFFFNRIPKAANSTVARMLASHSDYCRPSRGKGDMGRMLRPQLMSRAHVEALASEAVFKFTILRNPYARVLSAYRSKIELANNPVRLRRFAAMLGATPDTRPDFTTFCRFLDRGGIWRDAHWAPQTELLLLPLEMFDHIGRVETLEDDLALIARRIWGLDAPPLVERVGKRTDAGATLDTHYSDEARAIVARLYAEDFTRLGYSPDL